MAVVFVVMRRFKVNGGGRLIWPLLVLIEMKNNNAADAIPSVFRFSLGAEELLFFQHYLHPIFPRIAVMFVP